MKTNDLDESNFGRDAYQRDYDSSVSGMGRPDDHRGLRQELAHETNNIAVYINGKLWKVWAGKGTADSREERAYLNNMQTWAANKSAATGKKWTVGLTGANVSEAASAAVRMQRAADKQRAKSDASLARTPSSIPKKEEPKQPSNQKGVAEAGLKFNGGFPDVDHMNGPRGINLPSAETKKYFTDKKQWMRAVDDLNHSQYNDNSEYIGSTGRSTAEINGVAWAKWSDAHQKGYVETKPMSRGVAEGEGDEQGMSEGEIERQHGDIKPWAYWSFPERVAKKLYQIHKGQPIDKSAIVQLWKTDGPDRMTKFMFKPDVSEILYAYQQMSEQGPLFKEGVAEGWKDKVAGAALAGSMAMGGAPAHAGFAGDLAQSAARGLGAGVVAGAAGPSIFKKKNAADLAFAEQIPDAEAKAKFLKAARYMRDSRDMSIGSAAMMGANAYDEARFKKLKQKLATQYNIQPAVQEGETDGIAEGSDDLYQKAIRKYALRHAHNYMGGGDEHLYGANKFDADDFGVSPQQAQQDYKTLFPKYVDQLNGKGSVAEDTATNPKDRICVDVPLFIRLMEYAREDAKSDMDLHSMTERLTAMSANGETLGMDSYNAAVGTETPVEEASLSDMRDYFSQEDNNTVDTEREYAFPKAGTPNPNIPPEIQTLINKMHRVGKITPNEFQILKDFQKKTKLNVGIHEVTEPYAIGMAAAMKSTGDKPPLKKSTIKKAHEIAKKIKDE